MPTPDFAGSLATTHFAEILRLLVQAKQTGLLVLQRGEEPEGFVSLENGMIAGARTESYSGMHALFQFVSWHQAHFEFRQRPLAADTPRDLSVYDPQVLIAGVAEKAGTATWATND